MSPGEAYVEVHTVIFHPPQDDNWLSSARHRDLRISMAACVTDLVGIMDGGGLVVFPAGFLRAPSEEARDEVARTMLELSRRNDLGVVFGVDVGSDDGWAPVNNPPESFVYACEAGKTRLWPARHAGAGGGRKPGAAPSESRCIELSGMRVGVLLGSEVFNSAMRKDLERKRPNVIVALTHLGPTDRWAAALAGLNAIAPTLVVGESTSGELPAWATSSPEGWTRTDLGGTPTMTLNRHRPTHQAERFAAEDSGYAFAEAPVTRRTA